MATGSSPTTQGLFARYTPTFRLPNLSTYTTASLTDQQPHVPLPVTQTMDLAEIGYKFANQWTDLYATAFWTKYNNVGFTNYVFNPNSSRAARAAEPVCGHEDLRR